MYNKKIKPFIKWVGGKRNLVAHLHTKMPERYTHYYEPFVGGGSLFFSLNLNNGYISDINSHLINTYCVVKNSVEHLIFLLEIHRQLHCKEYYYYAREQFNEEKDPIRLAAWFIYLNKSCYNGLYRVNKKGKFNVPVGSPVKPIVFDWKNLVVCSLALQKAVISCHEFDKLVPECGAFYYLDPPYYGQYSSYDTIRFGEKEHIRLYEFCREINEVGGYFLLSNSDTEFVRELYKEYIIEEVDVHKSISCKGNGRKKSKELLIRNY
ncbi:MAG: DNA adenine methylase [Brevinema sp.]